MRLSTGQSLAALLLALGAVLPPCAAAAPPRVFGWVEEGLIEPEGIAVKIKLDTGALTSSLDAKDLQRFDRNGERWVSFRVELKDANTGKLSVAAFERPVERNVKVRGAGGTEHRPVVMMTMCIGKQLYTEQFSLKNRGKMNYPVLIGRRTLEHLGAVDVSRTFTLQPDCATQVAAHP